MFCNNCGTQLADGAAFCPNCGTNVANAAAGGAQPTNNSQPTGGINFNLPKFDMEELKKLSPVRTYTLGALVAQILVLILWFTDLFKIKYYGKLNFSDVVDLGKLADSFGEKAFVGVGFLNVVAIILLVVSILASAYGYYVNQVLYNYLPQQIVAGWCLVTVLYTWIAAGVDMEGAKFSLTFGGWLVLIASVAIIGLTFKAPKSNE